MNYITNWNENIQWCKDNLDAADSRDLHKYLGKYGMDMTSLDGDDFIDRMLVIEWEKTINQILND